MKYLNIIFITLFAFTTTLSAQEDAISRYFDKYVDDDRFTVIYISPRMFELIGDLDINLDMEDDEAAAVMDMIGDIRGLRVLTSEEDSKQLFQDAINTIDTKTYETLMTVRSKEAENVQFLIREKEGLIDELLLLVDGEDEFVLLSFLGTLDMKKISKLINAFEEDDDDEYYKTDKKG